MPGSTPAERAAALEWALNRWPTLTRNQQGLIRFGIFPAAVMEQGEAAGLNGHALACALMDCASKNGGMRA